MYADLVCGNKFCCIGTSKRTTFGMAHCFLAWHCSVRRTVLVIALLEYRGRCGNPCSPYRDSLDIDAHHLVWSRPCHRVPWTSRSRVLRKSSDTACRLGVIGNSYERSAGSIASLDEHGLWTRAIGSIADKPD